MGIEREYTFKFHFKNSYEEQNIKFAFDSYDPKLHFIGNIGCGKFVLLELKCTTHTFWQATMTVTHEGYTPVNMFFSQDESQKGLSILYPRVLFIRIGQVKCDPIPLNSLPIKKCKYTDDFSQLFESKTLSDVVLVVGDEKIPAHKNILASRSTVFKAMFEHEMSESLTNEVKIVEIEPAVFKEMLRFIYTDEVLNLNKYATKLLPASDMYDLPRLKYMCEKALTDEVKIENAAETLICAELYQAKELKKWILKFMKENIAAVIQTPGYQEIIKSHSHLLTELLLETFKLNIS